MRAGVRITRDGRFGFRSQRHDKYPRGGAAERQRAERTTPVSELSQPRELQAESRGGWNRRNAQSEPRPTRHARRRNPCGKRAQRTGHVKSQAPAADRNLDSRKMKRTFGALMADEARALIHERRGGNQDVVAARGGVRCGDEDDGPQARADRQREREWLLHYR